MKENADITVFISYSTQEEEFAHRLASNIRSISGIDVWFDLWKINPGELVPQKLAEALAYTNIFVPIITRHSNKSSWVNYELNDYRLKPVGLIATESRGFD